MSKTVYYKCKEYEADINVNMNSLSKSKANNHNEYDELDDVIYCKVVFVNKYQGMKTVKTEYHVVKVNNTIFILLKIGKNKDDEQHK